jgi:hypothetical protein
MKIISIIVKIMNNKNTKNLIFLKKVKDKFKLISLKKNKNYIGDPKYSSPNSKEWKNQVYFFNINSIKDLPSHDININKIIKSFFNMYLKKNILFNKYISHKSKFLSLYKTYVSKPEIKHFNSKIIITIYIFDKEFTTWKNKLKKIYFFLLFKNNKNFLTKNFSFFVRLNKKLNFFFKNNLLSIYIKYYNIYNNIIKYIFYRELIILRKYLYYLNINKYKYKDIYLFRLSYLLSKFYNKKVEFNIINLQSIILNTDVFLEFLKLKSKRRKLKLLKMVNFILAKLKLPKVNTLLERARSSKNINYNLLDNKYNNTYINSIINQQNDFDFLLKENYEKFNNEVIFDNIKYKNIRGMRIEFKGRLTRRYRADRAIYKIRWKGGLKNIDSSFKGLSTINYRGFRNSNVEYSLQTGKRRIGAFAIKGWIAGK